MPTVLTPIRLCTVDELLDKGRQLFLMHREELESDLPDLDLHTLRFKGLEQNGSLFTLATFDADQLIGYSVNVLSTHAHYSKLFYCVNDALFVHPDCRGRGVGGRLMGRTEREAKARGAEMIVWHTKPMSDLYVSLTKKPSYQIMDVTFTRDL